MSENRLLEEARAASLRKLQDVFNSLTMENDVDEATEDFCNEYSTSRKPQSSVADNAWEGSLAEEHAALHAGPSSSVDVLRSNRSSVDHALLSSNGHALSSSTSQFHFIPSATHEKSRLQSAPSTATAQPDSAVISYEMMLKDRRIQELETEVSHLRDSYDGLFAEYRAATEWISGKENYEDLFQSNQELFHIQRQKDEVISSLQISIAHLTARLSELQKQDTESLAQRYESELKSMEARHEEEVGTLRSQIASLKVNREVLSREYAVQTDFPFRGTLQSANAEIIRLSQQNESLQKKSSQLTMLKEQISAAYEEECKRRKDIELDHLQLLEERENARSHFALVTHELSSQIQLRESDLRAMRSEVDQLKAKFMAADRRIREKDEDLEAQLGEIDAWKKAYTKVFLSSEAAKARIVKDLLSDKNQQIHRLHEDHQLALQSAVKQEKLYYQRKIAKYREDREKLKQKIATYKNKVGDLEAEVAVYAKRAGRPCLRPGPRLGELERSGDNCIPVIL
eukprot:ANDGO_03855.mRNA.1 hypothetical protein